MINFLIILIILFFLGIYLQKKNFLVDNTGFSKHKSFVKSSKKIPVTGGLFLLLTFIFFNLINLDFIYFACCDILGIFRYLKSFKFMIAYLSLFYPMVMNILVGGILALMIIIIIVYWILFMKFKNMIKD